MNGILLHRRNIRGKKEIKQFFPTNGLYFHADETSTVISGTQLTAWNNKAGLGSLTPASPATIILNDGNFNGISSIDLRNNTLSGIDTAGIIGEGATFVQVIKTPITVNGDGTMLWFWNRNGGPLDVWTYTQNNDGLYFNTFNSTRFGNTNSVSAKRLETRIVSTVFYNNNIITNKLYENGQFLPMDVDTGGLNNSPLDGIFYPAANVVQSPNYNFYGYISEFLFYNRVLTAGELEIIHNLLRSKYHNYIASGTQNSPYLTINEQDARITFVGQWTLEQHPAYIGASGKYIQNSSRDGYLQLTVPDGYNRVRFEGIVGNNGGYGQFDYLRNNQILGSGSFYRDMQQQWAKDVYFDISVQPGDLIRQVFYAGTGFCDQITFYNSPQQSPSAPASYYEAGQSVEDDSADWTYEGNWNAYNGEYHNGNCHYLEVGASGIATLNKPAYCSTLRFTFGSNSAPRSSKLEIRKYGTTDWIQQGIILKDGNEITLPELAYWEIRQKENVPSDYTVVDFIEFL